MKALVYVLTLGLVVSNAQGEVRYTAKVFDFDSNKTKLLYAYKSESKDVGDEILVTNEFKYPDGRLASHEEITFLRDGSVRLLKIDQTQIGTSGQIEIGGGKAKFSYTEAGKTKTNERDAGPDFIIGSQIPLVLEANWDKVLKGEKIKRRLAVLDRLDDFGFEFSKDGDAIIDGKKTVKIKMKATSFFVAAIVDPLYFFFTEDGKTLVEIHGRTTVKKDVNGKFKDLDAVITYEKGEAASTPAPQPLKPVVKPVSGGNSK